MMKHDFNTALFDHCELLSKEAEHLERLSSAFYTTGNSTLGWRIEATAGRLESMAQTLRDAYHTHACEQVEAAQKASAETLVAIVERVQTK